MFWRLIIEDFGPNIQHIYGFDNKLSDTLSGFPYTPVDKYKPSTSKSWCHKNKLFSIGREENNEDFPPLNIVNLL